MVLGYGIENMVNKHSDEYVVITMVMNMAMNMVIYAW